MQFKRFRNVNRIVELLAATLMYNSPQIVARFTLASLRIRFGFTSDSIWIHFGFTLWIHFVHSHTVNGGDVQ